MSVYEYIKENTDFDFYEALDKITDEDIKRAINKKKLMPEDFLALISKGAENYLEEIAQKAHKLTEQYFGKTVLLYTPIYLANYCVNKCAYCGYNHDNDIHRKKLTLEEIEKEAIAVSKRGFKHIIFLTGESQKDTPVEYIIDATKILKKYFSSLAIEIYPLTEEDYKRVVEAGVDSLTVYQECYDEKIYDKVHVAGPKKNYKFRLDAIERGCKAGIRSVNLAPLLGLNDWRIEVYKMMLHGLYLRKKYPEVEVGFSTPRIRPCVGGYNDLKEVSDKELVQAIIAMRLMFPNCTLNISSREGRGFREKLIPLGVNKVSAGVSTAIGGHTMDMEEAGEVQFDINDSRDENEMKEMIRNIGYEPIFKDWLGAF
ncbi:MULTISPECIES: 2-iminoacetate synthase ThiH [Clostridium]|uniref:2-iminoacetate synthase ThiH n=1 Tax=Clostridium cibarium TaxID=2762247 RepID=A0ABR8PT84_9CLOT|nr:MULTISPECIES: 2-iminoacetate synthase ThiH [Clostridium]MBD7911382.1 2-iminoacetate synthase ThiH [Clostridium cibarium]